MTTTKNTTATKKKAEKPTQPQQTPACMQELFEKYQTPITHAFVLHGNVEDYIGGVPGQTLKKYLTASFGERIIVSWNRATGFALPTADMRQRFAELVEFPIPPSAQPQGRGFAAGLNQMAGSSVDLAKALERMRNPGEALEYLNRLLRARTSEDEPKAAILIDYAESLAPVSETMRLASGSENDRPILVTLADWGHDMAIGDRGHIIIMITNELRDLNERLRKSSARWEAIHIPLPTFEERRDFTRTLAETDSDVQIAPELTSEEIARMTTGLRYIDIEDIFLRASFLQQHVTRELIKARKDEIMASEFDEVLALEENSFGFEALGGMAEIKADLHETVITPMRSGQLRMVPQGLLLMGPAGTGKTRLARALAKESGVTFVTLQLSKIFSKWVGDTERRLEKAISAIIEMQPAIVFIDEIDQAISRNESGDSGVGSRVFKRVMEIMSDTALRGRVLWVGATNRPDLLDAALLRPGRFDKKIPILAPDAAERAAILAVLTQAAFGNLDTLPTAEEYQAIADQMMDYTGAEIEAVIGKAFQIWSRNSSMPLAQALQTAYERIIPTTQNIEQMTRLALLYCNDLDLVPSHLRDLARQLRHPQARAELLDEEVDVTPRRRSRNW